MKKTIIVITTVLLVLVGWVLKVDANTLNFNYSDNGLDYYSGAKIFNCTGSSTCNEVNNASVETMVNYVEETEYQTNNTTQSRIWAMTSSATTYGTNGLAFSLLMSDITFLKNAYYSTTAYVCYSRDVNINLHTVYVGTSYNQFLNHTTQYFTSTISNKISNTSFLTTANTSFQYCRAVSFIYQPNLAGNVLTIRLNSSDSVGSWVFVGTQTKFIGLQGVSASQVQSIVNNSGLATASSVQQVEQAMNNMNSAIEDQNDILTQNHTYNNNASQTIPGQSEIDNYTNAEDTLLDNLDLSGVEDLNIGIDANASNFIWEIVNRLRTIPGVLLMMTSALGLGLFKMILNR